MLGYVTARRSTPAPPYSLLAFQPAFAMTDLSPTRRAEADAAENAARGVDLTRVRVGNLLW